MVNYSRLVPLRLKLAAVGQLEKLTGARPVVGGGGLLLGLSCVAPDPRDLHTWKS